MQKRDDQNRLMKGLSMKKIILAVLCAASFYNAPAYAEGLLPKSLPRLEVEGNRLTKPDGTPVTLRGVSLCSLEWHKPLQQIKQLTTPPDKWNANVIRMPVQAREWKRVGPQAYIKGYLDPAVKLCTESGVYCIIDWHDIDKWNTPETVQRLETFWKLVAPRYASNKSVIYEIFNEPTEPKARTKENWLAWRKTAQPWVDMIRKSAPDTLLLIGTPHWDQMPAFAAEAPFKGNNLAYTLHVYPNWPQKDWDNLFGKASKTIPIFVTEWGWSAQPSAWWGIKGSKEGYGAPLRAYLDARPQINWTAWSYDPLCGPAMLGVDKDMGAFVKQWLKEANP